MTVLVQHDIGCKYARPKDGGHSDAAKRVSDWYNLHRVAQGIDAVGKWLAFALQDGTSDGILYDTKLDAIRHQRLFEYYYFFCMVQPCSMSVCEAESVLYTQRILYKLSNRQSDSEHPQGGRQLIPRLTEEDQFSMLRALQTRGRPSNLLPPREV